MGVLNEKRCNTLVQVAGASSSPGTVWTNITSSIGVNGTHLVLENEDKYSRYGIWVNGILSELTSEAWYDKQGFLEDLQ